MKERFIDIGILTKVEEDSDYIFLTGTRASVCIAKTPGVEYYAGFKNKNIIVAPNGQIVKDEDVEYSEISDNDHLAEYFTKQE